MNSPAPALSHFTLQFSPRMPLVRNPSPALEGSHLPCFSQPPSGSEQLCPRPGCLLPKLLQMPFSFALLWQANNSNLVSSQNNTLQFSSLASLSSQLVLHPNLCFRPLTHKKKPSEQLNWDLSWPGVSASDPNALSKVGRTVLTPQGCGKIQGLRARHFWSQPHSVPAPAVLLWLSSDFVILHNGPLNSKNGNSQVPCQLIQLL